MIKNITCTELEEKLKSEKKPFVIDVREVEEIKATGKIRGAIVMPLSELTQDDPVREGLFKNSEIVVNCKSGGRSARACEFLQAHGYSDLSSLEGGISKWITDGREVEIF